MRNRYSPIRIVIADDHHIFRNGFKLLLKNQHDLELVGEAEDGKELVELVATHLPEIVIADIRMPVLDGIAACKFITKNFPETRVIALSMFNDDNVIIDMLEAGASGYLLKNTNKEELNRAVTAVHRGESYFCAAASDKISKITVRQNFIRYRSKHIKEFTPRETEILKLICKQYSNKEIADLLGISTRTVETHRQNIQDKTGAKNCVGLVIYAIKHEMFEC